MEGQDHEASGRSFWSEQLGAICYSILQKMLGHLPVWDEPLNQLRNGLKITLK